MVALLPLQRMADNIEWDESQIEQEDKDVYHELFQNHDLDDDSCNSNNDDDVKDDNKNDSGVLGRIGIRKHKQKWTHLKQTKNKLLSLPPPSSLLSVVRVASNDDENDSNPSSLGGGQSNTTIKCSQENKYS